MVAGGALLGAVFGGLLSWTRGHNVREGAAVGASAGLVGGSFIQVYCVCYCELECFTGCCSVFQIQIWVHL